jgi:aminomethyltransferase
VNLEGREFAGREAIAAAKQTQEQPVRVGLELTGKRAAREHYAVYCTPRTPHAPREDDSRSEAGGDRSQADGITRSVMRTIGEVTSGTFSPTLQKPIAMAYVAPENAAVGTKLAVDIRGSQEPARVVKLPFYTRR